MGVLCLKMGDNKTAVQMFTFSLAYCYDEYMRIKDQPDSLRVIIAMCENLEKAFRKMIWPQYGPTPIAFRAKHQLKDDMLIIQMHPQKKHASPIVLIVSTDEQRALDEIGNYESF
jgi:hypothetical protein